ncbi:hypothetical protein JOD45_002161 [Scopulibacillus daqui]|uniref:Uncharacterized protein n=1 Tax=Scopulibacillus daqui TaxID=1469162 RepID=A0ABS2Q1D6_9BACL|nr:hypothetical protein [Scopulibacillus daqui]MBM7645936.1 hypothetical protein [Scopulibacillus daqui]
MHPKLGYIVNLAVTIICLFIFPEFILKSHPIYALIIGAILAIIINTVLGAKWRPWKSIKSE